MNQSDWYAKLLEWSHKDSRLGRLPYVLMVVLAEHLAEHEAAEQSVQRTATPEPVCTCKVTAESYKNCDAHGNRRR